MPRSDSPRLTIACIVRDAAVPLEETLRSVQAVADEIVIADTGSLDQTREIAAGFTDQLIQIPWQDSFSAARNQCAAHATGDWLLWMDAGETLAPETASQLKTFIDESADPQRAYMLLVKTPAGGHVEGEQVGRIRLVPRHKAIQFQGRIRESLEPSLNQLGISVQGLPYRLLRSMREHDPQRKHERARRNLHLLELAIREEGADPRLLNAQGEAWEMLEQYEQARQCYRQAIDRAAEGSSDVLEGYYGLLTTMDDQQQLLDEQLEVCLEALQMFPLDAQLLCAMGSYLQRKDRLDLAARAYETAYRYGQVVPVIWHMDQIREIAAVCFGLALQLQQQEEQALAVIREAVAEHPSSVRLRRQLLEMVIRRGTTDQALEQLEAWLQLTATPGDQAVPLRQAVEGACLGYRSESGAARNLLQAAFESGCRDAICTRSLISNMLASGAAEQARQVLQAWKQADPGCREIPCYQQLLETSPQMHSAAQGVPMRMHLPGTSAAAESATN